ncbi:SusC/RagA family TonB-linked outer membrane protein [Parasediminibacterium sp. JCM 36343]|uniref:SusC/RagA family TonB-linked outer membrane protein n=1 Tax=Parasediminibacterium sp. JCM 36343 TaxID=3374279 RepID=UPI003979AAB2
MNKDKGRLSLAKCHLVLFLALILSVMLPNCSFAQNGKRTITGKVTVGADGKIMSGVAVFIKGSTVNTITNASGAYSITVNSDKDILVFSYVGYYAQEVPVGKRTTIDLKMVEDASAKLDDVVVIGYGKAKKKDVTGAISSISGDELRKTAPTTFDQALQGKVAGVVVQQVSGQPGGGVSVQIRGLSSFNGLPPLYVIDGVFMAPPAIDGSGSNPLASINPAEIETIDILKDASATAIYGSQATGGVVIITTRRGQSGAPRISYDGSYGTKQLPKYYDVMNLRQYAQFRNDRAPIFREVPNPAFVNPQYLGDGTNWQKVLFRKAPTQNHTISISGGDARTQFALSGSYYTEEGIAVGSDFKRISVRFNLDNKATNWLKVGNSLQLANIVENVNAGNSSAISTALSQTPDVRATADANGNYTANDPNVYGAYSVNPYAIALLKTDIKKRNQAIGNLYAEIMLYKDLTLRNEVTGNLEFSTQDQFTPTYNMGTVRNTTAFANYTTGQNINTVVRSYFTYNHSFNKNNINFNAVLGHEANLNKNSINSDYRSNFPSNTIHAINNGDQQTARNSGDQGQQAVESYFVRMNAIYKSKYILTFTLRDDGSSKFYVDNRWVLTYSGAFAWRLKNEPSLSKYLGLFNDLKYRIGYGLTNNQNIPNNSFTTILATTATGVSGNAQLITNLKNQKVSWETTNYFNTGFDGTILNNKIDFTIDYYNRLTNNLLLSLPLPQFSGTTPSVVYSPGAIAAPIVNIGSMRNSGFDFTISSNILKTAKLSLRTNLTLSHNVNKVVSLNNGAAALISYGTKTIVGRSLGEFYGYQTDGLFTKPSDFKNAALPVTIDASGTANPIPIAPGTGGVWLGDRKFKDLDTNGIINENDQTYLGSPRPTYQMGFNNTVTYKNFDFNIFFICNLGNKVLNELNISGTNPNQNFGYFSSVLNYAQVKMIDPTGSTTDINNFYVVNPSTKIVRLSSSNGNDNQRLSNQYIENGSFVRCKTISIGYRLPPAILSKAHLNAFRVYASVNNVFLISKYSGYDPEVGSYNPLSEGVDNGRYPSPRTVTFGANLTFK